MLAIRVGATILLAGCGSKPNVVGPEAVPVNVTAVVQKDVPVQLRAIGNVEAYSTVTVKSQVDGELAQINFKEGQEVKEGDLLILAVLVIYIVLGILYESFVHPLTILSGLPSAGFGALGILMALQMELNIYAFVGLIMLIGIVKKNAIMQIDFALQAQRTEGKSPLDAIYQGCVIRFRPIMMTTMSALLGTLPIAAGMGAGAESRRPLGVAVGGGLLFSQLVTLYLTPVYYTYIEAFVDMLRRVTHRPRRTAPHAVPAPPAVAAPARRG